MGNIQAAATLPETTDSPTSKAFIAKRAWQDVLKTRSINLPEDQMEELTDKLADVTFDSLKLDTAEQESKFQGIINQYTKNIRPEGVGAISF